MPREVKDVLRAYGAFVAENDAAQVFHLWVAIGTIAAVAQRKIFMRPAHYYVHSNMYVLLVSPAGRGKKSTALRIGKELLAQVEPQVNFAAQSGSFEGLVKAFGKVSNASHQSLTLFSSELGVLMATNPAVLIDFFNDIYDCNPNWDRSTVKHDLQNLTKPWMHFLGGTTPRWISDNSKLLSSEGGFFARMIIPYSEERKHDNAFPELTEELLLMQERIVHTLSHIATLEFEFKFEGGKEGEARQWYDHWYKDPARFPEIEDPRTAGYFDRKHVHLLKVAMALSLSYKDDPFLTLTDLQAALELLNKTEPGMRVALQALGKNEWSGVSAHLLSQIRHAPNGLTYRNLLVENLHNAPKKKLDELLEELLVMGRVDYKDGVWSKPKPKVKLEKDEEVEA